MKVITIREWIQVLRSNKYKQGQRFLASDAYGETYVGVHQTGEPAPDAFYCCLGVHAVESGVPVVNGAFQFQPRLRTRLRTRIQHQSRKTSNPLMELYGMTGSGLPIHLDTAYSLSELNDGVMNSRKHSFAEIADVLEAWLEKGLINNEPKDAQ